MSAKDPILQGTSFTPTEETCNTSSTNTNTLTSSTKISPTYTNDKQENFKTFQDIKEILQITKFLTGI